MGRRIIAGASVCLLFAACSGASEAEMGQVASGAEAPAEASGDATQIASEPSVDGEKLATAGAQPMDSAGADGRRVISVEDWLIEPSMAERSPRSFSCPAGVEHLSVDLVRQDMAAHERELAQCTVDNAVGEGRITVHFMVDEQGKVESIHPEEDTQLESVGNCFRKVFESIDFCASSHESKITAHYVVRRP